MLLDRLVRGERVNAAAGWTATGTVVAGGAASLLANATLWGVFSLAVAAVVAIPALTTRNWTAMVSWPLPAVAAVAVLARVTGLYADIAGYLAIAALALVVVVELDAFTPVELSRRFAVAFAVLTTMALQAVWIIAQFYSDQWLGSEFMSTQTELQWDIVSVTVVGVVLGALFEWFFARFEPVGAVDEAAREESP